jgi:HAD superfamily hydrolase (TIGR01459 family)
MPEPELPEGLGDLAPRYDAILCDVWGVIHNGREAYVDACTALERYRAEQGPVVLISNSPRPSAALHGQLEGLKVPRGAWSAFVTSGDATRPLLEARAPGPVWAIGPLNRDGPLYEGLGLEFVGRPEAAAFVACTGPDDEETERAEDYRERLAAAAERDLLFICANPDRWVQKGDRLIPCAGALADLYQSLGGPVLTAGKPYGPIYDLAMQEAERAWGRPLDRSRVLCIGDGMTTDVPGAHRQGLDCLFLWEGVHAADLQSEGEGLTAAAVAEFMARHETLAAYAMPRLVW